MKRKQWAVGVCRESDSHPWEFYMDDGSYDGTSLFKPTTEGLVTALNWCGDDKNALMDVWQTWNHALQLNADRAA